MASRMVNEVTIKISETEIADIFRKVAVMAKRVGISKTALKDYIDGVYRV